MLDGLGAFLKRLNPDGSLVGGDDGATRGGERTGRGRSRRDAATLNLDGIGRVLEGDTKEYVDSGVSSMVPGREGTSVNGSAEVPG
jgi:hypothetical protein